MPISAKFNSRQVEMTEDGIVTTLCWTGKPDEIESFSREIEIGAAGEDGTLTAVRVYPESPKIWVCERKFLRDSGGEAIDRPNTVYGKKSAQVNCSMLAMPLEAAKNYRTNWNHYLAAAPGTTAVPSWWETAKDAILSHADSQKYAWIKSLGETPVDKNGRWHVIKNPEMPGQETFDVATYSITEVAKFRSARAAGRMIANTANKIGIPAEDFGLTPSGYNWKCDNVSVSYNGRAWFATLTWTRSGNNKGWNMKPYEE